MHARAAAWGGGLGAAASLPYGVAHGLFIAPVVPPLVAGAIGGALAGAAVGAALAGRAAPAPSALSLGLLSLCIPLAVVAFVVRPLTGDLPQLWPAALAASLLWALLLGRLLAVGPWAAAAFAFTALIVAGPGEPFVHEGPEPRIVLFFAGLAGSLALAGALAGRALRAGRLRPA